MYDDTSVEITDIEQTIALHHLVDDDNIAQLDSRIDKKTMVDNFLANTSLSCEERQILVMRYIQDHTVAATGRYFGMSAEKVRNREYSGLRKIRRYMVRNKIYDDCFEVYKQ